MTDVAGFLDRVLQSQGGRDSLPYSTNSRWIIREQLVELQKVGRGNLDCRDEAVTPWLGFSTHTSEKKRRCSSPPDSPEAPSACSQVFPTLGIHVDEYCTTDGRWGAGAGCVGEIRFHLNNCDEPHIDAATPSTYADA